PPRVEILAAPPISENAMGSVRALKHHLHESIAHDIQPVGILPLANQRNSAQVVALNFTAVDQLIDKLLRNALEQLEFLRQHPNRAVAVAIRYHLTRFGIADQELEAVTWKIKQLGALLGCHHIGGARQTTQRAEFTKKCPRGN